MEEYTKVLKEANHKIFMHVDAGQAYGKFPMDMNEVGKKQYLRNVSFFFAHEYPLNRG